jgi:antitoxin HicB
MKFNPKHLGTHLEELLAEDGNLDDCTNAAVKAVLAWQFAQAMKKKKLTKRRMAEAMNTSRAQLDRVLDPKSGNVTIATLQKAARAVGRQLKIELA